MDSPSILVTSKTDGLYCPYLNCAKQTFGRDDTGSIAALERTPGELFCCAISLLLSASSVLLTNASDWGTSTKQLDTSEQGGEKGSNQPWTEGVFFSILCCKWQTWICPSKRCRKLLICSVWVSCWFFWFGSLGTLLPERRKKKKSNLLLPLLIYLQEWLYWLQIGWLKLAFRHQVHCYLRKNQKIVIFCKNILPPPV